MGKVTEKQELPVDELIPYAKNARVHEESQVELIAKSIKEFGFLNPILIDQDKNVIAGHGRILAAQKLGMKKVPVLFIEGLTEEQRKAYVLADNRLTELGGWDMFTVEEEYKELKEAGFDVSLTGFDFDVDGMSSREEESEVNPVAALPESHVIVSSISAFGTDSEKFIEIVLEQDIADHILEVIREYQTAEIAQRFREALRGL